MSASARRQSCIKILKSIRLAITDSGKQDSLTSREQVDEELGRMSLWIGNIGAMHAPSSPMSLESRLRDGQDILDHILTLLSDLHEVAGELLAIVSGKRVAETVSVPSEGISDEEAQNEETELIREAGACITRLFRVTRLIRQAAPTDLFAKALSRDRYRFNDQYDIAHVGEKYPRLANKESIWLQERLGRAITQRRHYLSYIQDHREKLEKPRDWDRVPKHRRGEAQTSESWPALIQSQPDLLSRSSTFFTKASSLMVDQLTPRLLNTEEEVDPEDDSSANFGDINDWFRHEMETHRVSYTCHFCQR
ncbi:hypothetical protein N0V95_007482 [Ascochyta clinopodiicola]|nr:hypothetical protein N0V95_007482 [Ascochyta clinopodiicola]